MEDLAKRITDRLEELRVHLQADGGDLEIVGIEGKTVKLRADSNASCARRSTRKSSLSG